MSFKLATCIMALSIAAMAASQRTAKQLRGLEAAFAAMKAAREIAGWTAADLAFHDAILEATGNPFMLPLGSLIRAALNTLLFHSAKTSANPFDSLGQHQSVLEAIRRRDPDGARQAMSRLLADTGLSISKAVKGARRHALQTPAEARQA